MTKQHQQNILRVIETARKVVEEAPETLTYRALDFHVQTPLGDVQVGNLHLWLDNVPLVGPISEPEFWQPVADLYMILKQAWLSSKLVKQEADEKKVSKALEALLAGGGGT